MSHYDVLGVPRSAGTAEIRRAYLRLARRHHPDHHAGDPRAVREAEDRMRRINAAWHVLSDPGRRALYDLTLDEPAMDEPRRAHGPTPGWRPFHDDPDEPDPRDFVDARPGAWRPPVWMTVAPGLLVAGGMVLALVGLAIGIDAVVVFALLAVVAGGVLFLITPLQALADSRRSDRARGG